MRQTKRIIPKSYGTLTPLRHAEMLGSQKKGINDPMIRHVSLAHEEVRRARYYTLIDFSPWCSTISETFHINTPISQDPWRDCQKMYAQSSV